MSTPVTTWSPPLPEAAGFEHHVVETPGLRTHLAVIGEGEPVLLLHGFPQHWWQWHEIAPAIAEHGYRVYCPDLRGAGWTVADDPHFGRETRLHDLLALLDALGIERAHVVSHDMATLTVWQLVYDHPERVRTSVQLSVPPPFLRFHVRMAPGFRHMPSFIWHREGTSMRPIFSPAYLAHPLPEETIQAHLAPMSRPEIDAAVRPMVRRSVIPEALRMVRGTYRRKHLGVPTLVVFGRRDGPWTEEVLARACRDPHGRLADRVEFAHVEDAAHYICDDAPAEVTELALDWFERAG